MFGERERGKTFLKSHVAVVTVSDTLKQITLS
jgi:hypothetical protein